MTKKTLISLFEWLSVDKKHYSLDGGLPYNKYVFSEENEKFKVYFCENGINKMHERLFSVEDEALKYFLHFISTDSSIRKKEEIQNYDNPLFDNKIIFSKELLSTLLEKLEILPKYYSIDAMEETDKYILCEVDNKWHVYGTERGYRINEKVLDSENEACRYFLWYIAVDPSVRK
jgi:hypothetical protein